MAKSALEGICASLALKLFMMIMPNILLIIIRRFFCLKAGTWAQLRLQRWYYCFMVIFVVLAPTVQRGIIASSRCVLFMSNGRDVLRAVEATLPDASHFYLCYMLLGMTGMMVNLLRPIAFMKYSAFRSVYEDKLEAVARAQDEHPAFFGTGVRMTKAATMMTITLVFCLVSPLICFFALLYFMVSRKVYGYLILHAEVKRPDLGGIYWVQALQHIFVSLLIFIFVMTAILAVRAPGDTCALVTASSVFLWLKFWRIFRSYEWRTMPLDWVTELDKMDREGDLHADEKAYMQPELVDPECSRARGSRAA